MASLHMNMNHHLVIDGLPENVDAAKQAPFKKLLETKIAKELGKETPFALKLLIGQNGMVSGAFLDCRSVVCADRAVAKLNRYRLTKTCEFRIFRWADFEMINDLPEEYLAPEVDEEAVDADMTNTFMLDDHCKPQFVLKTGDQFQCQWQCVNPITKKLQEVRPSKELRLWSELDQRNKKLQKACPAPLPMWSPRGTFLVTRHRDGIKLWAGKHMQPVTEFTVPELQYIAISPSEKYMVTFTHEYTFWDIQSAKMIRTIPGTLHDEDPSLPVFHYNSDDSLVATYKSMEKHRVVNIYNAHTMKLQPQEPGTRFTMEIDGLTDFAWSPVNPHLFAYAVRDPDSAQGVRIQLDRVSAPDDEGLVEVNQIVRRNFMKAVAVHLLWHPQGTHLAAKIVSAAGNATYTVFRVGSNTASVDTLDVKGEPVRFAWQPNTNRCSVITAGSKSVPQTIHFFDVQRVGYKPAGSFPTETVKMFWAPKGTRCLAINFDKSRLEFYGVQGSGPFASTQPMALLTSVEHPMVTDATWDPTGRFICSYTSSLKQQMDNSYYFWNVNGQQIFHTKTTRLSHVHWRPVMPSMLTEDDLAEVRKALPKKSEKYTADALEEQRRVDDVVGKKRREATDKYCRLMDKIEAHHAEKETALIREELIESAPAMRRIMKQLDKMAPIKEEVDDEEAEAEAAEAAE